MKNNQSEIDSSNFFLSKNGKFNSLEELNTTINNLVNPKYDGDNSTYCKYPARRFWIKENFNSLIIKKQKCPKLMKELSYMDNINKVTLVFPTTHLNSPASMFGHTLLRLDNNVSKMTSLAINYAANTDEKNGLIYAWKGLTGGYLGNYSIVPYYKKIQEYSGYKNRDIWEYELNFNKDEIRKMILHLFEIKSTWSYYKYFNRNCSYEILWLIESARETANIVNKFNYKTLPIDTIRSIHESNLVLNTVYRPSSIQKLTNIFNKILDQNLAIIFNETYDYSLLEKLSLDEKINISNYALGFINYKKNKSKMKKNEYLKQYIKLLKYRSKLGKNKNYTNKKPVDPVLGHGINKIWLHGNKNESFILGYKPSLHGFEDVDYGYLAGSYIDFFSIELLRNENNITLHDLSIFKIKSLSKRNKIIKPYSWQVDIGAKKFKNNKSYLKFKVGVGATIGTKNALLYILLNGNYFGKKNDNIFGYGYEIGSQYNFKSTKFGFKHNHEIYKNDIENNFKVFINRKIHNNFSLEIGYKKESELENGYIGLNYYY